MRSFDITLLLLFIIIIIITFFIDCIWEACIFVLWNLIFHQLSLRSLWCLQANFVKLESGQSQIHKLVMVYIHIGFIDILMFSVMEWNAMFFWSLLTYSLFSSFHYNIPNCTLFSQALSRIVSIIPQWYVHTSTLCTTHDVQTVLPKWCYLSISHWFV